MPSRSRIDSLPSTLAAPELPADIWDDDRLGQCVHVDVAGLTCRDHRTDAVLVHVAQAHRRPGLFTRGHSSARAAPGPPACPRGGKWTARSVLNLTARLAKRAA